MTYTDAHCHLSDPRFSARLDEVLARAESMKVKRWIQGGVEKSDWARQIVLKDRLKERILIAFGLHPWALINSASEPSAEVELKLLEEWISKYRDKLSALGELGLDHSAKIDQNLYPKQEFYFREQLKLARKFKLPVILHIVNAHEQALEILKEHGPHLEKGIVHSFSSSYEIAKKYLDLGYTLSIGTAVTREGFRALKSTVSQLSDTDFVLETDSPDQPTAEDRAGGLLNEPSRIWQVAQAVANLRKSASAEQILDLAEINVERIFGK